jgi:7,8-dihydroneopterin aldolase/epimerase/oxygenase
MMTIVVARIGFEGRHGATAAERRSTARFEVDVEIDVGVDAAGRSDRLADTVDYRRVAEAVVEIGTGEPRRLLEHLGTLMMDALARLVPQARAVRLEIRKLNPPGCAGHPACTEVRVRSENPSPPAANRRTHRR